MLIPSKDKKKVFFCLLWSPAERWWMKCTICWHLINYSSKMKRATALIGKQEKGSPKKMRKNKNCLILPPSPLVGPIYNIAFTEEVPFDCRNVTRISHKHCCALFFLPQTLWKIWTKLGFGFSIKEGIPPPSPVIWAHAYGIDSASMNCRINKEPVKQTKLIPQDYSDLDFDF